HRTGPEGRGLTPKLTGCHCADVPVVPRGEEIVRNLQRVRLSVKSVVTWPPLNRPLTGAVHAVLPEPARHWPPLARYLPRAGMVEVTLPSGAPLRLWSQGDDDIGTAVFWRGWAGHEPETATYFLQLAASARVVLDVGAHIGYFSLLAALTNPRARVLAFEPLAAVRDRLLHNVRLNDLDNVSCLPVAVGSHAGVAEFFHVSSGIPSSSGLSEAFMRSIVDEEQLRSVEVEVTTVDAVVRQHDLAGAVDLVKIDTETTEDDVLRGMVRTLEHDRPSVVCEILTSRTADGIESLLEPYGYRYYMLTDTGPRPVDHIRPHPRWRNFAFLPA
ncbi:MAG: FkbM family methyltransferase, partial [Actinomycetota bacterium]|nr:FkbM family methyltransferase [Actinomycetota bacterium]